MRLQRPVPVAGGPDMNPRHAFVNGLEQSPMPDVCMGHLAQLVALVAQERGRRLDILEVGSLFGESASVLAAGGHRVFCVDLFTHGLTQFTENTHGMDVRPIPGNSLTVLPTLPAESYDLVFLDGDHTWPVVEADLWQARRLLRPGGAICGDDLEYVIPSAERYAQVVAWRQIPYVAGARPGARRGDDPGYHPGVSCAVYAVCGPFVEMRDRFWWVRP